MKDELILAILKLVELFSWIIEFLIEFTSPGLILLYIASFAFPTLKLLIHYDNQLEILLNCILIPSILGIILYSIGSTIYVIIQKKRKLSEKTSNYVQDEYARIKFELHDHLNDPEFNDITDENKLELIKKYVDEKTEFFKHEFKNFIGVGILKMSHVNIFLPNIKKEVRYTLSPNFILFTFTLNCLSVFILLMIYSIIYTFQSNIIFLLFYTTPLIILTFLIYTMVEYFNKSYLVSLMNIWLSIGEASKGKN